jgi:hypothetical protein
VQHALVRPLRPQPRSVTVFTSADQTLYNHVVYACQ